MQFNKLEIEHREIFEDFLSFKRHDLSVYTFENIFIWKGIYEIFWAVIRESLCLFFSDDCGCFLYLSPLSKNQNPQVIKEVFRFMDKFNKNSGFSRIENIESEDLPFFKHYGYRMEFKSHEYLCLRSCLDGLKGPSFKSKRAPYNYFIKNYRFEYMPFLPSHKEDCLGLYSRWMQSRKKYYQDSLYQGMLTDSRKCLKVLLDNFRYLNLKARIIKVGRVIKAFTCGFEVNPETFCILYEITDLSLKGISQFIFRNFCRELKEYKYINIMDDSGLDNLKRVKLSYRPEKLIPSYIALRSE
ncbi:MAG: hypothetical protein DRP74_02820 [Candidatus Omnitrophota bacterium]|nr:MAG: hypothetical protein DRP74_02820 [Candidatus Omnitrophota bacterium]